MRKLLLLIFRFRAFFFFLALEILCFFIIIKNNNYQNTFFNHQFGDVQGVIYNKTNKFKEYLSLTETNEQLVKENLVLKNNLQYYKNQISKNPTGNVDSTLIKKYNFFDARIIKNSVYLPYNILTIDKGLKHGILPGMGVLSDNKVLGLINQCSDNFSTILPIINKDFRVSAKLEGTSIPGSIGWEGSDYRKAVLYEIPQHIKIKKGDSVFTSSYSGIFPEGSEIGTINSFIKNTSGKFYTIQVDLTVDFLHIDHVYVVQNKILNERNELEKINGDE